jgi:hypothetical protein
LNDEFGSTWKQNSPDLFQEPVRIADIQDKKKIKTKGAKNKVKVKK